MGYSTQSQKPKKSCLRDLPSLERRQAHMHVRQHLISASSSSLPSQDVPQLGGDSGEDAGGPTYWD